MDTKGPGFMRNMGTMKKWGLGLRGGYFFWTPISTDATYISWRARIQTKSGFKYKPQKDVGTNRLTHGTFMMFSLMFFCFPHYGNNTYGYNLGTPVAVFTDIFPLYTRKC